MVAAVASAAAAAKNGDVTVSRPAGATDGELLVAIGFSDPDDPTFTIVEPSGWSLEDEATGPGGCRCLVWTKTAASEPTSWTWTMSAGTSNAVHVLRVTGAAASPVEISPVFGGSTSSTTSHVAPSISPTTAAALLICATMEIYTDTGVATHTPPSGMTEQTDQGPSDFSPGYQYSSVATQQLSSSGATGTKTFTSNIASVGGSGGSVTVSLAIRSVVATAVSAATETDAGQALGRQKSRTSGLAAETDTAQALARLKTRAPSVATETDAALAAGRVKTRAAGSASETDTALAIGRAKAKAVGVATETDTALTVGQLKVRTVGVAAETEAALPVAAVKARTVGVAAETDQALAVTAGGGTAISPAAETDTALAVGRVKIRTVGVAVETDTAVQLGRMKARTAGLAAETDAAQAAGRVKSRAVGRATEADAALPIPNSDNIYGTLSWVPRTVPTLSGAGG